jgi:hypothetical protein
MVLLARKLFWCCCCFYSLFTPFSNGQLTTGRQQGMKEILFYDTTDADAVQFQCNPLDGTSRFNPRCNLNPTSCETWRCQGSASLTYCDSEFFVPGRTSDVYQLFNCTNDNVATCDSDCTCITGTYVGSGSSLLFDPDGGNCSLLDSNEGSLAPYPTETPTFIPTKGSDSPSESNSQKPSSSPSVPTTNDIPSVSTAPTMTFHLARFCVVLVTSAVSLSK